MELKFPDGFVWGTSSAATQIETASEHQWKGVKSRDGYVFERTTDHEKRREEDLGYICRFGSLYRCSVDWARLQTAPNAPFDTAIVTEYTEFFSKLKQRGMKIMFVFHHFTNPIWFENKGGWTKAENIPYFINYAEQCMEHFGAYATVFNTFNEPGVYTMNSFFLGNFPPFKKSIFTARKVIKNLGKAHDILYDALKKRFPSILVGISKNTAIFRGDTLLGKLPAFMADYIFIDYISSFFKKNDFWGISYYTLMPFRPFPITEIDTPGVLKKLNMPHDKMWAYYPKGLKEIVLRFHRKYQKPIWITENGVCTKDNAFRIQSIKDYLTALHEAIDEGVTVLGYTHWSTWDNFEWNLGPTYCFGLMRVNFDTMERSNTEAADFYEEITKRNAVTID